MDSMGKQHEINLWAAGFDELRQGRPFLVSKDCGYKAGDSLLVREYDDQNRRLTGTVAMFTISWVTKAADHAGRLGALLAEGTVVLGLEPANFLVTSPSLQMVATASGANRSPDKSHIPGAAAASTPQTVSAAAAPPPPAPADVAEVLRSEATRLRQLAKDLRLDQRAFAEALHRELMRSQTLPFVSASRASPALPS